MLDGFLNFVSDHADNVASVDFASLLGVATDDPNGYMKTKGQEMGREIMSKLMQSVYQEDGMEPPADVVVSRSMTPKDMVSNAGLSEGPMGSMLAPLVAGIVSSIQECGIKNEIVQFAQKRALKTIEQHSAVITTQGEKLGNMVVDGITTAVKARADPTAAAVAASTSRAVPLVDPAAFEASDPADPAPAADGEGAPAATARSGGGGGGGGGDPFSAAFMKPLADGVNSVLGQGNAVDRVIDVVGDWVPLDKVKASLKSTLHPQYQRACVAAAPQLEAFGGVAGGHVIEFMNNASGAATDQAKDNCARAIAEGDGAFERELMAPLLSPFMRGMLGKLAESGFGGAAALGLLSKVFGCFNKPATKA